MLNGTERRLWFVVFAILSLDIAMPPKGSKKKTKVAVEEQPPLLDEQPPLPDEQPPLPDEQPPLPDEQPPLPDEQPPLPNEQPPLPNEQPPLPNEQPPLPAEQPPLPTEQPPHEQPPAKDKGKAKPHPWQAVWSAERSAWYFWNTETSEVTWTNPLAEASSSKPAPSSSALPLPPRPKLGPGGLPEIDPGLAHLVAPEQRDASTAALSNAFAARTGRNGADYGYSFAHLDEYNRAKRFSEHYFDVDGWERQRAQEGLKRQAEEAAGITRETKISKKDMVGGI